MRISDVNQNTFHLYNQLQLSLLELYKLKIFNLLNYTCHNEEEFSKKLNNINDCIVYEDISKLIDSRVIEKELDNYANKIINSLNQNEKEQSKEKED